MEQKAIELQHFADGKTPVLWVMLLMFIFANAAGTMMVSATSPMAQNQIGQSAMTLFNMIGRISFGFPFGGSSHCTGSSGKEEFFWYW